MTAESDMIRRALDEAVRAEMTAESDMIRRALDEAVRAEANLQPCILMNLQVDHSKVAEYTSCPLNDNAAPKIKEMIAGGWTVFRIQTELCTLLGHTTMVYFDKTKYN